VRELGKGGVVPTTLKLKVGDEMFAVSYKPIDDLVLNAIHPMIVNNTILSFDLVVGADHGQGSMQCVVKIILRYTGNETKTIVKTCAEIPCKKESYELLRATIAPPINQSIYNMIEGPVTAGRGTSGTLLYDLEDHSLEFYKPDDNQYDMNLHQTILFNIFMTGNLAFIATCLGKEGSASWHCYVCDLKYATWQAKGHDLGKKWTLDSLLAAYQVSQEIGKRTQGMNQLPLITCVCVDRFTPPLMHIMLGIANGLFDNTVANLKRVPGLEDLPLTVEQSRLDYFAKMADHDDAKNKLEAWQLMHKDELELVRIHKTQISKQIRERAFGGQVLAEANVEKNNLTEYINQLVAEEKHLKSILSAQKERLAAAMTFMEEQESQPFETV